MGWCYANEIQKAGGLVLATLRAEGTVRCSRFYDGTERTHHAMTRAAGLTDDEPPVELLIELAVGQLEHAGLVTTCELEEKLADRQPDYEIRLTERGRVFLTAGNAFAYEDVEL